MLLGSFRGHERSQSTYAAWNMIRQLYNSWDKYITRNKITRSSVILFHVMMIKQVAVQQLMTLLLLPSMQRLLRKHNVFGCSAGYFLR